MQLKSAVIKGNNLLVNGTPVYIRGGEIQYFRLPVSVWKERLRQAVEGGLNTVSSYTPWYWHEPEEGKVDLEGGTLPERNFRLYLELAAEAGLYVIARPGPFINSELRCGGLPQWLFEKYPQTLSRRGDGAIGTGRPIPAEGETLYRDFVRRWYAAVVPVIAEYDIHNGGPVILFQPDNELSAAWSYGLLNSLYDPAVLEYRWPAWLGDRYKGISALNDRYGTRYPSFAEVKAPPSFPSSQPEKNLCRDWMDFKRWFFADWGAVLAEWAREYGLRVPVVFNEPVAGYYGHGDHAGFGSVLKARRIEGCTACHTYSDRLMDLEGIVNPALGIELVKSGPWGGPPLSIEANTQWYMPRLSRSEINWEGLLRLGLGHGLKGSVIYPYTAGRAPLEDTIEGPDYFPSTCIDADGNGTEGYRQLRRFNDFVQGWERELAAVEPSADVIIGYTPGQRQLDFLGAPALLPDKPAAKDGAKPGGELFDTEPALNKGEGVSGHDWLDGYEGVSKQTVAAAAGIWSRSKEAVLLLNRLNLSWGMLDLTNPNREPGQGWIIVPCTGSLEREAVTYLLQHLDAGGGCLFFPTIPLLDLEGRPDNRLAERLGIELTAQVPPAGGRVMDYGARVVEFGDDDRCGVYGWIYRHRFPADYQPLAALSGSPVIASHCGDRGRVVVAGLDMSFTTAGSLRLWERITAGKMAVSPSVRVDGNWLHAMLNKGTAAEFLVLMNLTGRYGESRINVKSQMPAGKECSFAIEIKPHEARCLVLNTALGSRRILYTTSEIVPVRDGGSKQIRIYGPEGSRGEICFGSPTRVRIDGCESSSRETEGLYIVEYIHRNMPLVLEITV